MARPQGGAPAVQPDLPPAQATLVRWRKRFEEQFPGLANGWNNPQFSRAMDSALMFLKANPAVQQEVFSARQSLVQGMRNGNRARTAVSPVVAVERADRGVLSLRLARVAKSVLLEEQLRSSGDTVRIAQFDKLKKLESGNPIASE
jgi:hypothetical protein